MKSSQIKIEEPSPSTPAITTHQSSQSRQIIMESISTFKSAIPRIRDILRSIAITGMDSMRHICIYLLSRYMTHDKVAMFGLPEELCWENFMDMIRRQNGGKIKALDLFYHPEVEDCLLNHFDNLFDTKKFSFDLKHTKDNKEVNKHAEILEILDKVDMTNIECQMDILGWVYEQHLGTGAKSGRDLGQFFTDRFICEYMTRLCRPAFKSDGVPESVCDPSMGTGGFLAMYIKYYKEHYPDQPVDWSVQQKEIYGCDTDVRVATVARINLFMEMKGARAENLLTQDSLSDDTSLTGYDIILANMPFGLKGLKYTDCSKRIKALKIQGTKSEPLFLQLMMVSLNRGGRCAVVVPDGMLVNQSGCHDGTRKYLLDHFELKRVIKMRGQFFMNTGIQPSILFFENTGNPTTAVEFWDVVKGSNGSIEETMVLSVPRERFDASCSLDMRRYQEAKEVANPAGYETLNLGDLFEVKGGKAISKVNLTGTLYPYYGCNGINGHVDEFLFDGEYIVCAQDGSIGSVYLLNEKFYPSNHTHILKTKDTTKISNAYGAYFLKMNVDWKSLITSVIPKVTQGNLLEIKIIVPPIEIQHEIVATLDRIYAPGTTELAETLKLTNQAMDLVLAQPSGATLEPIVEAQRLIRKSAQMVADVKAQMVADVKAQMVAIVKASMAGSGCTKYILSDLANDNPDNLTKADKFETINYVDLGSVKEGNISTIQTIPFEKKPSRAQRKIQNGDIIWGGVRPLSRSYAFIDTAVENMIGSSGFVVLRNKDINKVLSKYLYYVLTTDDCVNYLNSHSTGSSYPAFNASAIMAYEVVIPSITIQTKTLERLTALQSQLTALESLQRQSEDNARFILESYLGDSSSVSSSESESEPEIRIIRDDAKDERETGVVYVDPEQMEPVTMTNNGYAATASSTASSTVKVVKCKKPVTSKASKAS